MPLRHIGFIFSLSQVAQVLSVLCAPLLFRRIGLVPGIALTQLATALSFIALSLTASPGYAAITYVTLTTFLWMNGPGTYSLVMDRVSPDQRASAAAAHSFTMSAAQLFAATLAGSAFVRFGYPPVLAGIAAVALIAALVLWITLDIREPHPEPPPVPDNDILKPEPQYTAPTSGR